MKNALSFLVVVVFAGLCFAQNYPENPTPEPSVGKCPKEFSMLDYMMKPKPCHREKPYCPKGLICCPCPKSGKKYCIRPRMDDEQSVDDSESFWEELKKEFMEHKDHDDYDCKEEDDDEKKEDGDRVYEMDRLAEEEEGHRGKKKHHMRCHHRHRIHRILRIVLPVVGLVVMVAIAVAVACCIRRRRMRRAEKARKSVYTPENIAPLPEKASMKGVLGLDFSPEVFVSSEPAYKKLEEEKERI